MSFSSIIRCSEKENSDEEEDAAGAKEAREGGARVVDAGSAEENALDETSVSF